MVEVLLKAVPRSDRATLAEALKDHHDGRLSSPDSAVWTESGAAEMNARLLAGDHVLKAIDDFEEYIRTVLATALMGEHDGRPRPPRPEWDAEWEEQRRLLIEAMRHEQKADLADPPDIS
jgi:hypothetical protein